MFSSCSAVPCVTNTASTLLCHAAQFLFLILLRMMPPDSQHTYASLTLESLLWILSIAYHSPSGPNISTFVHYIRHARRFVGIFQDFYFYITGCHYTSFHDCQRLITFNLFLFILSCIILQNGSHVIYFLRRWILSCRKVG
jgi:hypothetical protein